MVGVYGNGVVYLGNIEGGKNYGFLIVGCIS